MAGKSLSQLLTDWRAARQRMEKLSSDIPRIMGATSVKVVKENFKVQGYDSGTGVNGWNSRSEKTNRKYDKRSGVKGAVYQSSNPLLMQTRNLYNSIKYSAFAKSVTIGVDSTLIPYAERMNKGGGGVPARKFIPGPDEVPNQKILKRIHKNIVAKRNEALTNFKK